jgi:hypothetical protein
VLDHGSQLSVRTVLTANEKQLLIRRLSLVVFLLTNVVGVPDSVRTWLPQYLINTKTTFLNKIYNFVLKQTQS